MPSKVLFLVPYPLEESPSQRFRFEQYFSILEQHGIRYSVQSFLDSGNWQLFFKPGKNFFKVIALLSGFARRWFILFQSPAYDFVFIHREATPVGPPLMEWLLAKVFRRKIIYDFDDAIWLTDRANESWILQISKWRSKVKSICRWSYKVSCGNAYLSEYASAFNRRVNYIPTTIDTVHWHNPDRFTNVSKSNNQITIGWTGSHSTLKYLTGIEPVLRTLEVKYPNICLLVIADRKPELSLQSLQFINWKKETEVEDLMKFDIGIMPLPDDEWAKGKCGFKALQYLSLKIPAIVSPVGVNTVIVDHGVNGFLASDQSEWLTALESLIENATLRKEMGNAGRKKVIERYSVISTSSAFVSLFE